VPPRRWAPPRVAWPVMVTSWPAFLPAHASAWPTFAAPKDSEVQDVAPWLVALLLCFVPRVPAEAQPGARHEFVELIGGLCCSPCASALRSDRADEHPRMGHRAVEARASGSYAWGGTTSTGR
jgi:hypothetical protein